MSEKRKKIIIIKKKMKPAAENLLQTNKEDKEDTEDKEDKEIEEPEQTKKSLLGQFYTKNYGYIFDGFKLPDGIKNIIEPFAGSGDLLNFVDKNYYNIESYDIDPQKEFIEQRDTILDPPDYNDKFIITNPPFLARNKCKDKTLFDKYGVNDLYKCFLKILVDNKCLGGIMILPLNFWCSIRKMDIGLRKMFLNTYQIEKLNIFEERVFEDTSYSICSFMFKRRYNDSNTFNALIFPYRKEYQFKLNDTNNYMIGGDIYSLPQDHKLKITRLIENDIPNTNILLKCIDDSKDSKICLKIVDDEDLKYDCTPNKSERSYATLCIEPSINLEKQKKIVEEFNKFIEDKRTKFHSLFLTNYRESNDIARKRISFDLTYKIVNYLISQT